LKDKAEENVHHNDDGEYLEEEHLDVVETPIPIKETGGNMKLRSRWSVLAPGEV
jgi:hypothetical protein